MRTSSAHLMVYGFLLLLIGFLVAFAMVIRLIEASFLLGFISYISSLVGLVLGLFGAFGYVQRGR